MDLINHIIGAMEGLGIGDKFHGPTDRALVLTDHLIREGKLEIATLIDDYIDYYHKKHDAHDFDAGRIQAYALKLYSELDSSEYPEVPKKAHEMARGMSAGIGAAHRSIPLAVYYLGYYLHEFEKGINLELLKMFSQELTNSCQQEACITHYDFRAGSVSAFHNLFTSACILKNLDNNFVSEKQDVLNFTLKLCNYANLYPDEIKQRLVVPDLYKVQNGPKGYYLNAIEWAIHIFLDKKDFLSSIREAFSIDPSNYVGIIVGIWCGAYYGAENIPQELRKTGYKVSLLKDQCLKLFKMVSEK